MSDEQLFPDRPRLMTPEAARDIARLYKALSTTFASTGDTRATANAYRESNWRLTYALAPSQTSRDGSDEPAA